MCVYVCERVCVKKSQREREQREGRVGRDFVCKCVQHERLVEKRDCVGVCVCVLECVCVCARPEKKSRGREEEGVGAQANYAALHTHRSRGREAERQRQLHRCAKRIARKSGQR